jgi:hypothetical protein
MTAPQEGESRVGQWLSHLWRRGIQAWQGIGAEQALTQLGDFTTTQRVMPLSAIAIVIGVLNAFVALALLKLIGYSRTCSFFSAGIRRSCHRPATRWGCGQCLCQLWGHSS